MALRLFLIAITLVGHVCISRGQPRHVHIIKAIPLPLINPLYQTLQVGYEYHYAQRKAVHVEAGYFNNELILYDMHHQRIMQGVKFRAEHRFYSGGGNISDLWNNHSYIAPHALFQSGWLNYQDEFARHGGSYFEMMDVHGTITQIGLGATFGFYLDAHGPFVVEGSFQVGIKANYLSGKMPSDVASDFFPAPWRSAPQDVWYLRPLFNVTLGLGWGWGTMNE